MNLKDYVASIENYPKEGIIFRDITPLMNNGEAYKYATEKIVEFAKNHDIDIVVGPEARGFIFGCPVSYALGVGFVPVRKPGKLPREVVEYAYDLEYGSNKLCLHKDAIKPGQKVLVVDDLLATGLIAILSPAIAITEAIDEHCPSIYTFFTALCLFKAL